MSTRGCRKRTTRRLHFLEKKWETDKDEVWGNRNLMVRKGNAWVHQQYPFMMTLEYKTLCGLIYPDNYMGSASGVPENQKPVAVRQTELPFGN